MAFRLYVVPVVGSGAKADPRRPKYFTDGTITSTAWTANVYGFEPWCIVGADLSTTDDTTVAGKPDVFALPFDLTPTLTNPQVNNVSNKLEAAHIPADWVNTSITWTQLVRKVLGMFTYFQRYSGIYGRTNGSAPPSLFVSSTLDSTFGSLSSINQSALISAAQSFGFDTSVFISTNTIRLILDAMGDNFQNQVYNFGPFQI